MLTMGRSKPLTTSFTAGSQTNDVDWITDITLSIGDQFARFLKLIIFTETATVLNITLDGTNFFALNDGNTLTANTAYEFNVPVNDADVFNIQAGTTSTITRFKLYIFEDA